MVLFVLFRKYLEEIGHVLVPLGLPSPGSVVQHGRGSEPDELETVAPAQGVLRSQRAARAELNTCTLLHFSRHERY